jgi:LuxR family maltose regulon positive regulatory protein
MESTQSGMRLLQTKLFIPRAHPEIVERPSLIRKFNEALNYRLILVSAPAGYGKTTLLSNYFERSNKSIAWVSLDDRDNEQTRFWSYFIAALQTLDASLGKTAQGMLQSPQQPPVENILSNLLIDISMHPGDITICLDDYHSISQSKINEGMVFLIENLPAQMRLIIAGRSEPSFPLPLLRARRQLYELNAADLRFSRDEAAQFLNQLLDLNLSADEVTTIEDLTEGWAAGLQLAGLSIQTAEDKSSQLETFSGSHRFIFDYLAQEVLNNQSEEVQNFLLRTAILDQLSGALCDSILENILEERELTPGYSQSILEYLERANLFIIPLDQHRRWYRYHRLFSDFLRAKLADQTNPSEIKELHFRASSWFKDNNMMHEAIDHAFSSGNYSSAAALINGDVEEIFSRSELPELTSWLRKFPPEVLHSEPRLNMIGAWAYLATGQSDEAESHLQIVEDILGSKADGSPESQELPAETRGALAEICCIRTSRSFNQFNLEEALSLSNRTLAYLTEEVQSGLFNEKRDILAVTFFNQAVMFELKGKITRASKLFSKSIELNENNLHLVPMAISRLANLQELHGSLGKAEETYHLAMRITEDYQYPLPLAGMTDIGFGSLSCERNNLEDAEIHLKKGIELGYMWSLWELLTAGYMHLARVEMAKGEFNSANTLIDDAISAISKLQVTWPVSMIQAYQAMLWVRQGKLEAASGWLQSCGIVPQRPIEYNQETIAVSLARVWIAIGKYNDARTLIDKLIKANESRQAWGQVIQLLIFDALASYSQGEHAPAFASIKRALDLAVNENYQRIFLDEGDLMESILRAFDQQLSFEGEKQIKGFINQLLHAFLEEPFHSQEEEQQPLPLLEPLSEREDEVIRLLEEGLTNQEIAARLYISLNTVKAHLKSIYSKLGVNNRVQAVAKGREIGLY